MQHSLWPIFQCNWPFVGNDLGESVIAKAPKSLVAFLCGNKSGPYLRGIKNVLAL